MSVVIVITFHSITLYPTKITQFPAKMARVGLFPLLCLSVRGKSYIRNLNQTRLTAIPLLPSSWKVGKTPLQGPCGVVLSL